MNQKEYFISKNSKENDNNLNKKNEHELSKEKSMSNLNQLTDSLYNINDFNEEKKNSIKDSLFKGLCLFFIYFSVIIYSLLYMLSPEKNANLIFEGNINLTLYNDSLYNNNNEFYKLDTIRERNNQTILEISKRFLYKDNDTYNKLTIELFYLESRRCINKILISNDISSKQIYNNNKIYYYYKLNDFPFWLALFNKESEIELNITSYFLKNSSFDNF